jgi:hypothetical protein
LLSAVVGAVAESQHEAPDAWGVAASKGTEAAAAQAAAAAAAVTVVDTATTVQRHPAASGDERQREQHHHQRDHQQRDQQQQDDYDKARFGPRYEIETSWDEYGGRGGGPPAAKQQQQQQQVGTDAPLSATATDGATTSVTATGTTDDQDHDQVVYMSRLARERAEKRRAEEEVRFQEQKKKAAERLRLLESKMAPVDVAPKAAWDRVALSGTRGLWEPGQQEPQQHQHRQQQQQHDDPSHLTGGRLHHAGPELHANSATPTNSSYTGGPVIHLSSYEDRDRGERKDSAAAPRMLYDPKSGSMVAVKARDTRDDGRKERGGKKVRPKNGDAAVAQKSESDSKANANRKNKGRKDDSRTNGTAAGAAPLVSSKLENSTRKKVNPERRLPRTCGVMYARDEKGALYCADGCEGDLGYGAHSVRGGRARNANAYTEYMEKQYKGNDEEGDFEFKLGGNAYESEQQPQEADEDVALYTGFNPPEEQPEPVEWIKPTDKIELVTGLDDSPSLKPTAKEWSPSQHALAAAAAARALAAKNQKSLDMAADRSLDDVDEMEDDDDDDDPITGLGFDPTQDMEFMHSPPTDPDRPSRLGAVVELDNLELDAPMYSSASSNPSHIFSFGTSGTWGGNQAAPAGNSDWNVPGLASGIFGADAFRGGNDTTTTDTTSSFLNNIPSSNSWGSPAGLGNLGVTMNSSDTTTTTGD